MAFAIVTVRTQELSSKIRLSMHLFHQYADTGPTSLEAISKTAWTTRLRRFSACAPSPTCPPSAFHRRQERVFAPNESASFTHFQQGIRQKSIPKPPLPNVASCFHVRFCKNRTIDRRPLSSRGQNGQTRALDAMPPGAQNEPHQIAPLSESKARNLKEKRRVT